LRYKKREPIMAPLSRLTDYLILKILAAFLNKRKQLLIKGLHPTIMLE